MLKKIIRQLFTLDIKKEKIHNEQHNVDIEKYNIPKGDIQTIITPDLNGQKDLILTKWYFNVGDKVKHGDIICDIQNDKVVMEFETFFNGKIIYQCNINTELTEKTEICKIEGV